LKKIYPKSKVEVRDWEVPFYDLFLNIITGGRYASFIAEVVRKINIEPDDRVLDLGAGTGRNARLILPYLSGSGNYLGMDISRAMVGNSEKNAPVFLLPGLFKLAWIGNSPSGRGLIKYSSLLFCMDFPIRNGKDCLNGSGFT